METFHKLFGSLLLFVYHCFDRMVILAYLPLLTREENLVHFFRDVNGIWPITQEALRERTNRRATTVVIGFFTAVLSTDGKITPDPDPDPDPPYPYPNSYS